MAQSLKDIGFDEIDFNDFLEGFKTNFNGNYTKIPKKKAIDIFNNYVTILRADQLKKNTEISAQFLEKNKEKEGVVTLASGLQYKILTEGKGEKPKLDDRLKVLYEGYLMNKNVFDITKDDGPLDFHLSEAILGWQEALQLMPVGSRWEITIPSHLAYGEKGAAPMIEPNAVVSYIIELLEIEK